MADVTKFIPAAAITFVRCVIVMKEPLVEANVGALYYAAILVFKKKTVTVSF